MKVKISEPVGSPLINYERRIKNRVFNPKELEELVKGIEADLNRICSKLDDRIACFGYELSFRKTNSNEEIDSMAGGFDLSAKGGKEYALPGFIRYYKKMFKGILENPPEDMTDIYISLTGFGDKITHEVEAKEP